MALLAEEVCGCKTEVLSGGLSGSNDATIIRHLWGGQPVLIPYPAPKQSLDIKIPPKENRQCFESYGLLTS